MPKRCLKLSELTSSMIFIGHQRKKCNLSKHSENQKIKKKCQIYKTGKSGIWQSRKFGTLIQVYAFNTTLRSEFKTLPAALGGCYCLEQQKPSGPGQNRWSTGGSVRVRAAVIVQNNRNRPDPDRTAGQTLVEF